VFKNAASVYYQCLSQLCIGPGPHNIVPVGNACLLSQQFAITAHHCVSPGPKPGLKMMAFSGEAVYECVPFLPFPEHDLCVVELTRELGRCGEGRPLSFPTWLGGPISLGSTVGYLGRFCVKRDQDEIVGSIFFSSAEVSFPTRSGFALANGFVEPGFSGSPVFLPDGALVGVIEKLLEIRCQSQFNGADLVRFPVVRPVNRVAERIAALPGVPGLWQGGTRI
jgi:hypothetical protein